jgi:hypothetical protein
MVCRLRPITASLAGEKGLTNILLLALFDHGIGGQINTRKEDEPPAVCQEK